MYRPVSANRSREWKHDNKLYSASFPITPLIERHSSKVIRPDTEGEREILECPWPAWERKVVGKSCGSVTDYQCWGNFWVSLGSRLYRVQDRHGARQPSEAWCQTQRRICLCTQTWKEKRKMLKECMKKGNMDHGPDANVGKSVFQKKMAVHGTT